METILVPIDFSDATPEVVRAAGEVANSFKARLIFLHVVEPVAEYMPIAASMDVLTAPGTGTMQTLDPHPLQQRLERLAEPLRTQNGLDVTCEVRLGLAMDEILQQAHSHNCRMIIVGSHGHGALYHLFTGSVVTGILKGASFPVLVVPVKEKKEAGK